MRIALQIIQAYCSTFGNTVLNLALKQRFYNLRKFSQIRAVSRVVVFVKMRILRILFKSLLLSHSQAPCTCRNKGVEISHEVAALKSTWNQNWNQRKIHILLQEEQLFSSTLKNLSEALLKLQEMHTRNPELLPGAREELKSMKLLLDTMVNSD